MNNPFSSLQGWIPHILNTIKKDIKTDHLHTDPVFYRLYFGNRPQNRLTSDEILAAYEKELLKGNEELNEWVVNRWVFKHGDVYNHFADGLSAINPNFHEIESLTEAESQSILQGTAEKLGAVPTFLFSVLNGVVFPPKVIDRLRDAAEKERSMQQTEQKQAAQQNNLEQLKAGHEREVSRLREKYETKLAGVQKKYAVETAALKNQIRSLQQKLHALTQK